MTTKSLGLNLTKTVIFAGLLFTILLSSGFLASAAPNKNASSKTQLNIYSDSACRNKLDAINWGSFMVGQQVNKTVYIKNAGTTPLTLTLAKTNWNPQSISISFTCVWNQEKTVLSPNQIIAATLTLTSNGNFSVPTSFSMNVVITGTC